MSRVTAVCLCPSVCPSVCVFAEVEYSGALNEPSYDVLLVPVVQAPWGDSASQSEAHSGLLNCPSRGSPASDSSLKSCLALPRSACRLSLHFP